MINLNHELAEARIDDLVREAADRRRAGESRERSRGARRIATRRRLMLRFEALRRTVRPSAQGPAA
jgi:hypothetical protein